MRITRQAWLPAQFVAVVLEPCIIKAPLKICTRIHAGRCMPLEVNKVARLVALRAGILRPEKVIEPNLKQRRQRRVGGDMSADARVLLVLPVYHRKRIPANQDLDAPLQRTVAGVGNFVVFGNRIAEGRGDRPGSRYACLASPGTQRRQHRRSLLPIVRDDLVKCLNPLSHLG